MTDKPKISTRVRSYLTNLTTSDGWHNSVTGMGILGRDKAESTSYNPDVQLDQVTLDGLSRGDAMARRGVCRVVDDAMRQGWIVTFKSDEREAVSSEQMQEYNERLNDWHAKTMMPTRLTQHLKQARHYGGSLLMLGAADGRSPGEPLDMSKLKSFDWVRPHDRFQVTSSGQIVEDPTDKDFGFPRWYTLHRTFGGGSTPAPTAQQVLNVPVHSSRVWRTDGVVLSERVRLENMGWGDSVLQQAYEPLSAWSAAMKASKTALAEFSQGVYKIQNLMGIITANGDESVRKRFHLMDFIKSSWGALLVDAENEEYRRESINVSGMPELIDRHGQHLASAFDQPMTLFFGQSPGGFGKGEAEGDNWDDSVKAYQTDSVLPALNYIYKILFKSPGFEDFPSKWKVEFNSLQLTSPVEEAEIRLKTAQADATYVQSGVLDADEVATSRFGGASYSTETVLDEETRELEAELEAEGLSTSEPLNGAQVASLLEMVNQVKVGVLPKPSAVVAITSAFPSMSQEAAQAIVEPIEVVELQLGPDGKPVASGAPQPPQSEPPDDGGGSAPPDGGDASGAESEGDDDAEGDE